MHHKLTLLAPLQENAIIATLSNKFGDLYGLRLFEEAFLWFYSQPKTRELPVVEEAAKAYAHYQKTGEIPIFFRLLHILLEARRMYTEEDCIPFARGISPIFWRYVFCSFFNEEPLCDQDKRWDELFKIGMPLYRKIESDP